MAVQLVSDEVHVVTGEPWRHWLDDRSWERIQVLARAYGFEEVRMDPGDYVTQQGPPASPKRWRGLCPTYRTTTP